MTHLHVAEHCPRCQVKVTISLSLPVTVRYSVIVVLCGVVFLCGVASALADQPGHRTRLGNNRVDGHLLYAPCYDFFHLAVLSRGLSTCDLLRTNYKIGARWAASDQSDTSAPRLKLSLSF